MTQLVLEDLWFKNAFTYRECHIPFRKQGLVFFRGLNVDDGGFLGSGKTSPFEILSLLLIGKGAKPTLMDDVVNSLVGKDFEAHLRLSIDEKAYEIERFKKHSREGNMLRAIDLATHKDVIPHKNMIRKIKWVREKLVQKDDTTFFHDTYLAQQFVNVILSGTDAERRTQIVRMFGLDVYDRLAGVLKDRTNLVNTDLQQMQSLQVELVEIRERLSGVQETNRKLRKTYEAKEKGLAHYQAVLDASLEEIEDIQGSIRDAENRKSYRRELRELWESSTTLHKDFDSVRGCTPAFQKKCQERFKKAQERLAALKSSIRTLERRDIIKARLEKLPDETRDPNVVNDELTEAKSRLVHLKQAELPQAELRESLVRQLSSVVNPDEDIDQIEKAHEKAVASRAKLTESINLLKSKLDDGVCPTCGHATNLTGDEVEEIKDRIKKLRGRLSKVTAKVHEKKSLLDDAQEYQNLRGRIDSISTTREIGKIQDEIHELTGQERDLLEESEASSRRATYETQLAELPKESSTELQDKKRSLVSRVEVHELKYETVKNIRSLRKKIAALPKIKVGKFGRKLKKLKSEVDGASRKIATLSREAEQAKERYGTVKELRGRRKKIVSSIDSAKQIADEHRCLQALKIAFSQKGLRHDRLHSILQDAAERTLPQYIDLLWPNRQVSVELTPEESSIRFQLSRHGTKIGTSQRGLSGGESHKAGLAALFSLRDLKQLYTGASGNVLILDEPFGNLDAQGKRGLLRVLDSLKERFESIFVISHLPEVMSQDVWDQVWWAVREDNESVLYKGDPPSKYIRLSRKYAKSIAA